MYPKSIADFHQEKRAFAAAGALASAVAVAALAAFSVALWLNPPSAFLLLGFGCLVSINYVIGGRDVLYPAFIFSCSWLLASVFYALCPGGIDSLAWSTSLIFVGGGVCFTAGCWLCNRPILKWQGHPRKNSSSKVGVRLLLLFSLVSLPLVYREIAQFVGQSGSSMSFLLASKALHLDVDESLSSHGAFLVLGPLISVPMVWLLFVERERRLLILLGTISAGLMCVLSGARGVLFELLCGISILAISRRMNRDLRSVGIPVAIAGSSLLLLMTLLTLLIKEETRVDGGLKIAETMTTEYIAGPLAGFNYQVVHPDLFSDQPRNTVNQLFTPLVRQGIIDLKLPPIHEESVNVGFLTNVYTIYKPYYHDFGPIGCMLVLLALGLAYGLLFSFAVDGSDVALYLLAMFAEPLVMSVFHDPFNYRLTAYVFDFGFIFVYFAILRKLKVPRLWLKASPTR